MPTPLLLSLAAVFVSVALLVGALTSFVLSGTSVSRKRLRQVGQASQFATLPELASLTSRTSAGDAWKKAAGMLPRAPKDMERLRLRLHRAGIRAPGAAVVYTVIEFGLPIVAAIVPFLVFPRPTALMVAMGAGVLSFFLPGLILERRLGQRRREIENGLPDALDLLVVCIEAGSGVDQAIMKTAAELAIAYPVLADELGTVTTEIRAGKPRLEAFKNFATRTKVDDVRALVAMLIQTDRFGTSIGQALRTHADISRTKRRQRAEEQAAKIGVKLVFPLVLCFFPAFYVVILGPAVIEFMKVFQVK